MRAFGGRGGLRICQVPRNSGQRSVLADGQVLRVGAADSVVVPKDPVTDGEGRRARAEGLDLAGELVAEDLYPWSHQPGQDPDKERLSSAEAAVCAIHRRRVNLDENLIVRRCRHGHVHHAHDVGRAVPCVDRGLHRCTVAAGEMRGALRSGEPRPRRSIPFRLRRPGRPGGHLLCLRAGTGAAAARRLRRRGGLHPLERA